MGKLVKGKKIYYLEICIEYVKEFIEGDSKCVTVGSVDMTDYWDDDTLFLLNDIDDVGIS